MGPLIEITRLPRDLVADRIIVMFTAVFQKSGDWWAAYIEEMPGVNSQGATLDQARENLTEALAMVLEANRELARRDEPADVIREKMPLPV